MNAVGRPRIHPRRDPRFFECEAALTSAGAGGRRCKRRVGSPGEKCGTHAAQSALAPSAQVIETDLTALLKKVGAKGEARRDPREVLLDTVTRAHQMVVVLDAMVREMTDEDMALLGYEMEREVVMSGRGGVEVATEKALKASHIKAVLELHGKWVAEAARISKATISAGVEDRLVRLAEQQSRVIADVIRGALEALPLSSELRQQVLVEVALRLRRVGAQEPIMVGPSSEEVA